MQDLIRAKKLKFPHPIATLYASLQKELKRKKEMNIRALVIVVISITSFLEQAYSP